MKIKARQRAISVDIINSVKKVLNTLIINDGKVVIMDDITSHFDAHGKEMLFTKLSVIKMDKSIEKIRIKIIECDIMIIHEPEFITIENNEMGVTTFHEFNFAQMFIDGQIVISITESSDR